MRILILSGSEEIEEVETLMQRKSAKGSNDNYTEHGRRLIALPSQKAISIPVPAPAPAPTPNRTSRAGD